jgi:hypothetical protein
MPSAPQYSSVELQIIAAAIQQRCIQKFKMRFRNRWVWQDDFADYYIVRHPPRHYVFVNPGNDGELVVDDCSLDRETVEWSSHEFHRYRPLLKWTPQKAPDEGGDFYEHECMMCGEGLCGEDDECLACGFTKQMMYDVERNQKILSTHRRRLLNLI